MKRSLLVSLFVCSAFVASAAEGMRPSAFEMSAWNVTMPFNTQSNAVFSPVGFGMTVAMLGEGIGGSGRAEMADTLGLISDFSVAFSDVIRSYADANISNRVAISIASSLWTTKRRSLSVDYINTLHRGFDAEAGLLSSVLPVNAWTEAKTDGRITNILPEMPRKAETIVMNAVAFEGAWKKPFNNERGRRTEFTREDGSKAEVKMLRTTCPLLRVEHQRYAAAKVEFAARGVSLVVVLPADGISLRELREKDMSGDGVEELKNQFRVRSGDGVSYARSRFWIPAFNIRSDWDLNPALRASKVPQKGFDRMGEDTFSIDMVKQCAYIKLTGRGFSLTPGMEPEPQDPRRGRGHGELATSAAADESEVEIGEGTPFVCDRPFLFFVWDVSTDTFVLAGQYTGAELDIKTSEGEKSK